MLTNKQIENAKPTDRIYRLNDHSGLYLEIDPNGSKYWRFRYRIQGKERRLALGIYPLTPLAEAREKRDEAKKLIMNGIDPFLERHKQKEAAAASKAITFESVAREWHTQNLGRW